MIKTPAILRAMFIALLVLLFTAGTSAHSIPTAFANACSAEDCPPPGDGGGGGGGGGDGGGGTGGGGSTYDPGPEVNIQNVEVPVPGFAGQLNGYSCNQIPHLFYSSGYSDYRVIPQGGSLALVGITAPGSVANFGIYTNGSTLVATHTTQPSQSNCVINQGPEYISTAGLAPGYYYIWGSYWSLTDYYNVDWYSSHPYGVHNRFIATFKVV